MKRSGNEVETCYPLGVKRCRDGFVLLSIVTDQDFDRLAIAMGHPELIVDPQFADGVSRFKNRSAIDVVLEPWLASMDGDAIAELLQGAGVVATKVATTVDLLSDRQLEFRGFLEPAVGRKTGPRMPGNPIAQVGRPRAGFRPAPSGTGDRDGVEELIASGGQAVHGPVKVAGVGGPQPFGAAGRSLTVLDATIWWAGPLATRLLCDLGARVIRIERPAGRNDTYHDSGEFVTHKLHRGKLSLAVDSRTAEGREVVLQLAASADVFVENFRPGVMARMGFDYASLSSVNPDLVYVSLSGFGSMGPRAPWGSHGTLIEAASSIESRTGYPGDEPMRLGHPLPDAVGGLAGALAVLRGLRTRFETGRGGYFDLSQLETYVAAGGDAILASSISGEAAGRAGNSSMLRAPQHVYKCHGQDEWVAVAISSDDEWQRFKEVLRGALGQPEMRSLDDALLDSLAGRLERQSVIDAIVSTWASTRGKREIADALQAQGVGACPVMTSADLASDPYVLASGGLLEARFGDTLARLPGVPVRVSEEQYVPGAAAPRLGEHSREILQTHLGLDEERIDALIASGVVAVDD